MPEFNFLIHAKASFSINVEAESRDEAISQVRAYLQSEQDDVDLDLEIDPVYFHEIVIGEIEEPTDSNNWVEVPELASEPTASEPTASEPTDWEKTQPWMFVFASAVLYIIYKVVSS